MAVINGTVMLLSSEGVNIALQRGVSLGVNLNLDDATNKESAGWAQHISGMLNASIDFDALFSAAATPVMSAKDLMDYILNRKSLLISILGLGYPIVGEADMSSLKFTAPLEQTMTLSGSLKVNGPLFVLSAAKEFGTGKMVNLVTNPEGVGHDYETYTVSGTAITSAINAAGSAFGHSNSFAVVTGDVLKCAFFFTKTSGEIPTCILTEVGVDDRSNSGVIVEGLNIITLTVTLSATVVLAFRNTVAAAWNTTPIYLFKV
jgi:predicted secreted protein